MKIEINNSDRIFIIIDNKLRSYACNLGQINAIISNEKLEKYRIYEVWNGKMKSISKKFLNELYKSNEISPQNTIVSIHVQTLGAWDKQNGNPYIAGLVIINKGLITEQVYVIPYQYGASSMNLQLAYKVLSKEGILPKFANEHECRNYLTKNNIMIISYHRSNCTKKELKEYIA